MSIECIVDLVVESELIMNLQSYVVRWIHDYECLLQGRFIFEEIMIVDLEGTKTSGFERIFFCALDHVPIVIESDDVG